MGTSNELYWHGGVPGVLFFVLVVEGNESFFVLLVEGDDLLACGLFHGIHVDRLTHCKAGKNNKLKHFWEMSRGKWILENKY